MERLVLEGKKDRTKKRQLNEEIGNPYGTPRGDANEDDVEVEDVEIFTNPITPTTRSRKGKEKPGIKSALARKEQKDAADLAVGCFWFDANLPFNAARSKFCPPMADAIAAVGPSYKIPSDHDLRGKILGKIAMEVKDFMEHYKSCWDETGCSIMTDRKELRQMFTSTAWEQCNVSSTPVGMEITDIILNKTFLKNVEHILKVSDALVVVLRLEDSEDKPAMGYVYEAMDRAKEVNQKRLKNKDYMPYWKIIDRKWDNQLHIALHAAAYYLNPTFFFSRTFSKHSEVIKGLNNVIEKLIPHFDTQDTIFGQCDDHKDSHFDFGSATSIRNQDKMSPRK
ncbi:zinc finger protein [Cinnamomum micranthum f. kanehirae]|uniref:Zinc finger protein n=1 Tax=Cinnamomum micranthum f. kanehirae TaxID=337451 RepID=A0A443N4D0_9MAGN|nr:zinc finger protein [Cinnamomum micranthum f. kanehirae]